MTGRSAGGYDESMMGHVEIAAALIAFCALAGTWFVVPGSLRPRYDVVPELVTEQVATAA